MNPLRIAIASFSLAALTSFAAPSEAEAGTNDYSCSAGFSMQGAVASNSVNCFKAGTETLRNNYPACGVRRYKEDGQGNTDWCTKPNGKKTGTPKCIGGKISVRNGKDRCVNRQPDVKKPTVRCQAGFTMQGSTTGRGSVRCYKAPTEQTRANYPVCGIRRYKEDGRGNTDWCTKPNGKRTGTPKCIGGQISVRNGKDRCVNKTPGKTRRPS